MPILQNYQQPFLLRRPAEGPTPESHAAVGDMLRPSILPSTHRARILPCNLTSIHTENPKSSRSSCFWRPSISRGSRLRLLCRPAGSSDADTSRSQAEVEAVSLVEGQQMSVEIGSPSLCRPPVTCRMSLGDQAFFLLAFIACTTSVAFTSLVFASVPTLFALKRAAISLAKLADSARNELPSTMAAIRLSGLEISDLTLELNDLSQEIADGISKSGQVVQAAEAGIRQIGAIARQQTIAMIQERANLPNVSLQPMVAGAARKTSDAVGRATKKFINLISRADQDGKAELSRDVEY